MTELTSQIQAFSLTLILGLITGVIFHYYQLFIRQARVGSVSLYIMDLVLWIFILALVFWAMICINQGEIRFYVLIAWLIGITIYFRALARRLYKLLFPLAGQNVRVLAWFKRLLARLGSGIKALLKNISPASKTPPPDPDD